MDAEPNRVGGGSASSASPAVAPSSTPPNKTLVETLPERILHARAREVHAATKDYKKTLELLLAAAKEAKEAREARDAAAREANDAASQESAKRDNESG